MTDFPNSEPVTEGFARFPEVRKLTGAGRTTIWRWEAAGTFPKRRRIGPNMTAWSRAELRIWEQKIRNESVA
jgi:prophage regulatory protein